ncbi:MAG: glycerol kinase GlpK [Haloarculaceae archaeon]
MEQNYVGVIDQGTTGTRFMTFDHDGRVVASAYERLEQYYPEPGWVEHDPVEIWEGATRAVTRGLSTASLDATHLATIGVTSQRETTVVWDEESGKPVHNALVWEDRRTTDRVEELDAETAERVSDRTGLEPDAYFSAPKLSWILDEAEPLKLRNSRAESVRDRAERGELCFGTVDSWLVYNLTGHHTTDVTNAARTMLYDIHELDWDDDLLAAFDVPRPILPEVGPSADPETYGSTDPEGFLGAEVPVTGVIGDQQAALLGQTCFDVGDAKNTYGTGSFYLMNTGEEAVDSEHGLLTTVAFQRAGEPPEYALEGAVFTSGGGIEWLEDVGFVDGPAETAELARSVDSTEGVYMVPAFSGLGTPYWDDEARGTLAGMSRGTRREHIVRATLESIAYQTRDIAEAMEADTDDDVSELRVDGGAVRNDFFCQLQADVLGATVVRPAVDETTALGAAYAAGLAVDYWDSRDELRSHWRTDREFEPEMDQSEADRRYRRWRAAVERTLTSPEE